MCNFNAIALLDLAAHFILAVIKLGTVNLMRLANVFNTTAQVDSNYKRLQRFFHFFEVDEAALARWLVRGIEGRRWILCLDRTNWKFGRQPINILTLAVAYRGIAIPVFWSVLGKEGNSSTQERQALLERFITVFGVGCIACLTADREFRGKQWLKYLLKRPIPFCLRIPNNTKTHNRHRNQDIPVTRLFSLRVGEAMVLNKPRQLWGQSVYLGATRTEEKGWVIIISPTYETGMLQDYSRRWEIETLFSCLKTRGFDLEATHMTQSDRIAKLMALLGIAFVWCYRVGEWQVTVKPVRKLKHGRNAKNIFRVGKDFLQRQWQAMSLPEPIGEVLRDLLLANNINKYYSPLG